MDPEQIKQYVEQYGPWAVGVGSTLDNTGLPIFFVSGMAAAASLDIPPALFFVAAVVGSILGDLGVYVIGRYYLTKDRILAGTFGGMFRPVIGVGERVMQRWGLWSIMLGRFIPYVGKIIPLLAGSYRLSWLRTSLAVTLGSVLLIGVFYFYADAAVDLVIGNASTVKRISVLIGTIFLVGLWWINHRLKQRADGAEAAPARRSRYNETSPSSDTASPENTAGTSAAPPDTTDGDGEVPTPEEDYFVRKPRDRTAPTDADDESGLEFDEQEE